MLGDFVSDASVEQIEKEIGYTFINKELLQQAFICRSFTNENPEYENNEVLEFIGDTVLDMVVVKRFVELTKHDGKSQYESFYDEGELTDIKTSIVKGNSLAKDMTKLELHRHLIMSENDIKNYQQYSKNLKENLVEAIIGAISIDSDFSFDKITKAVDKMIGLNDSLKEKFNRKSKIGERVRRQVLNFTVDNAINKLQELSQKRIIGRVNYVYIEQENEDKTVTWLTTCIVDGNREQAQAPTKIDGKKQSAYQMIVRLINM